MIILLSFLIKPGFWQGPFFGGGNLFISFIRTIILYLLVITVMRIMGKRQIGELQPFELVIAIMISELAAVPMQETGIPLIAGIIPIITLLIIQVSFSYLSMKNQAARKILCGTPSVVIEKGKIVEPELLRLRYNINDLLEQLREKSYPNISDIEYAILETSGKLSVIPKSQNRPATPQDFQMNPAYEELPLALIMDGVVNTKNLKTAKLTKEDLLQKLKGMGYNSPRQIFFATLTDNGKLWLQAKDKYRKDNN